MSSGRFLAERGRNPNLDKRELAWQCRSRNLRPCGQSHVNAALTYTRACGNLFNSDERGARYCVWDVLMAISEFGFTGSYEDSARYVELLADFIGTFDDTTDERDHPALVADPAIGYPEGQVLPQQRLRSGSRGLIYPSVRAQAEGRNYLVCFEPRAIQNVRMSAS